MSLEVKNLPCELEFRHDIDWDAVAEVTIFENADTKLRLVPYDADDINDIVTEEDNLAAADVYLNTQGTISGDAQVSIIRDGTGGVELEVIEHPTCDDIADVAVDSDNLAAS